jgi:hypothetical protein
MAKPIVGGVGSPVALRAPSEPTPPTITSGTTPPGVLPILPV